MCVIPGSIVLNVIFLNLLNVVICLRVVHSFRTVIQLALHAKIRTEVVGTYYFHAKSLSKHPTGSTSPWIQKTGLVNNLGTTPIYSSESPTFGATVA